MLRWTTFLSFVLHLGLAAYVPSSSLTFDTQADDPVFETVVTGRRHHRFQDRVRVPTKWPSSVGASWRKLSTTSRVD
jgi:hypothetical protein